MCGICGTLNFRASMPIERPVIEAMNRRIFHRGPDDEGTFLSGNVGLAMRRLSNIDLSTGHQPLANEDETVWVVYNGEIYNHAELREKMIARGHRYKTRSDTESIVHLYEEYGQDLVRHLRGMFAFALWDVKKQQLLLARDRLGIKPLYYHLSADRLLFASEIKSLLAHASLKAELNTARIPEYLAFGYSAGAETLFQGIRKLQPGHVMRVTVAGSVNSESYWKLPSPQPERENPEKYYVERYREQLEDAVASHLMSDVPLGVFLSGGVDSSAIAAIAARKCGTRLQTFSVGYKEPQFSELPAARVVARHIGSEHREVLLDPGSFFAALPKLIWHEDEPLMGSASVPLYFVSELAREHVKVVLTGEGSDETLAGYYRYPWSLLNLRFERIYKKTTVPMMRAAIRSLIGSDFVPAAFRRRLKHTFLARSSDNLESFYFDNFYSVFSQQEQGALMQADHLASSYASPYAESLRLMNERNGDFLDRMLYTDIQSYLVELLMKQDTMSMAASVESRVPFLDHPLVEFAASIPSCFKTNALNGKRILKSAVADLLPSEIIYQKKKGFPTPWKRWLQGSRLDEIERLLVEPRAMDRQLFQRQAVAGLLEEHRRGRICHSEKIWRLLNLELWHRIFIDQDPKYQPNHTANGRACLV